MSILNPDYVMIWCEIVVLIMMIVMPPSLVFLVGMTIYKNIKD